MELTLLTGDRTTTVPVSDDLVLTGEAVPAATGWEPMAHGLCRGEVCSPASLHPSAVTLEQLARVLQRPLAVVPSLTRDDVDYTPTGGASA